MLVLDEHLPADVVYGRAFFGRHGSVAVTKLNEFNLVGSVPGECISSENNLELSHLDVGCFSHNCM